MEFPYDAQDPDKAYLRNSHMRNIDMGPDGDATGLDALYDRPDLFKTHRL